MQDQISTGGAGIKSDSSVAEASLVTRRTWLGLLAAPLHAARKKTAPRTTGAHAKESPARVAGTVRERLWISVGGGDGVMTAAESALYLGTPNLILALPLKNRSFDRQLALSVSGFTQVVWAIDDLDLLARSAPMLAEFPNFTGVLLNTPVQTDSQRIPDIIGRRDIWMDVHQKVAPLQAGDARIQFPTVVVLWPGRDEPLESAFARWEKQGMEADVAIGCSIQGNPPIEFLQRQCDLALKWMRTGLIGGLVFRAGPGIGLDSAAIDWARQWVSDVGGQLL